MLRQCYKTISSLVFTSEDRQTSIANNRKKVRGSPWFTLIKLKDNSFYNRWRDVFSVKRTPYRTKKRTRSSSTRRGQKPPYWTGSRGRRITAYLLTKI